MIAKILIPILIATILTYGYFYWFHIRRKKWWLQLPFFLLLAFFVFMTVKAASWKDYFPDDNSELERYLHLLVVALMVPAVAAIGGVIGRFFNSRKHSRGVNSQLTGHRKFGSAVPLSRCQKCGEVIGWCLALLNLGVYAYGTFIGFRQFEVVHVTYASKNLPAAFDGYKVVLFSDAHVGTYKGSRSDILRRAVDSINAQHADLVVFAGDLLNKRIEELAPHRQLLSSIKAEDGVIAVMGNHDYAEYLDLNSDDRHYQSLANKDSIRQLRWQLLNNAHAVLRRGGDSIFIAGMENDGEGRFPPLGNVKDALEGVPYNSFLVMVEHDPTSWRRKILPECHAQLTLSGHTHGGQLSLLGLSPAMFVYKEHSGFYHSGDRALYVTKGLGGVVPFRLGCSGEIVVITLKNIANSQ